MSAVGVKASDKKFKRGYQYQCCMKRTRPTTAFYLKLPSLVVREMVALRPAEFMIP